MSDNREPVSLRLDPGMKARLQKAAEREDRSMSQQIRRYIREGLKRDRDTNRED